MLWNTTIYTLQFAGDHTGLTSDQRDLEYMSSKLKETYEERDVSMNIKRAKYLRIGNNK